MGAVMPTFAHLSKRKRCAVVLATLVLKGNEIMAERVGLYPMQFVVGTRSDAFFRYRNLLHPKDLF